MVYKNMNADKRQDIFLHKTNLKVTPSSSQAQTMPLWRSVWERRSFKPLWGRSRDLRQSGRNSASCKFFFFCQKELGSADSKWVLKENDRLGMCGGPHPSHCIPTQMMMMIIEMMLTLRFFFSTGASRVKETQQRSPWQSSTEISLGFVVILTS